MAQGHITTVCQILIQPNCNRLAKFLIVIRMLRVNKAQSHGSVPGPDHL